MIYKIVITSFGDDFVNLCSNDKHYTEQELNDITLSVLKTTMKDRGHLDYAYFYQKMNKLYGFVLIDIIETTVDISSM